MAKGIRKAAEPTEDNQFENTQDAPVHYEEWRMEKENGQLVKLKLLRPKVKITEDEAATLNAGAENGQGIIIQYFPKTN